MANQPQNETQPSEPIAEPDPVASDPGADVEPQPALEPDALPADPVAEVEPDPAELDPIADPTPVAATEPEPVGMPAAPRRWFRLLTLPWKIGFAVAALAAVAVMGNCLYAYASAPPPPPPAPTPAPAPTPVPVVAFNPAQPTPTPLPSRYAFVHFVNEMTACYQQRGLAADNDLVEADIMQDVPLAIDELLKLFAQEECTEIAPWYRIPGRVGWLLRASGMNVP